jgi:hypothetical protein
MLLVLAGEEEVWPERRQGERSVVLEAEKQKAPAKEAFC